MLLSGPLVAAVAILVMGSGCASMKAWKSKDEPVKFGDGVPSSPLTSAVTGADKNAVVQASATVPAPNPTPSSFAKMTGMTPKVEKKSPATEIVVLWRNKIDYLPDPTRNGTMGAGLAGQLFLFDTKTQAVVGEGKLTVALYDETPRPPGQPQNQPEVWEFTKETLRALRTFDERFGMCHALFLPWPAYRPDVTRVRIAARFEPEKGDKLYAPDTKLTIDIGGGSSSGGVLTNQQFVPGAQPQTAGSPSLLGGPPPVGGPGLGVMTAPGAPPAPLAPMGTVPLAPANYGNLAPANPAIGNVTQPVDMSSLPPFAMTIPRRQ